MKVVFCGSRSFRNPFTVSLAIRNRVYALPEGAEVIHGRARGADVMAGQAAQERGLNVTEVPADWDTHGKRAGVLRNEQMLDMGPERVIAFWDQESPGTKHMIKAAQKRGIPVEVHVS